MQERVCEKLWLLCNKNTLACVVIFYFAIPGGQLFEEVMPSRRLGGFPACFMLGLNLKILWCQTDLEKFPKEWICLPHSMEEGKAHLPTYLKATIPEEFHMYIYLFAAPLVNDTSTEQRMQTSEEVDSKICCVN